MPCRYWGLVDSTTLKRPRCQDGLAGGLCNDFGLSCDIVNSDARFNVDMFKCTSCEQCVGACG
ncbi:hypothetical protein ABFB09_08220 [Dehalogenimonas sp. THU2]|uniref:hypothetical protein n=1 Tax=Dehalogenimonas sp. THU2 TaxID=3151121 RepID=UPI003218B987